MKVIFNDKLRICIYQGNNARTFRWCCLNETYKDDCQKKIKFPMSFMIWGCMSFKNNMGDDNHYLNNNVDAYIEILGNFLIPLIEN